MLKRLWRNNEITKKFLSRTDLISIFVINIILFIAMTVLTFSYVVFLKNNNIRTAELSESFVNICFQQFDSVFNQSENIIKEHNMVLERDFRMLDSMQKVAISEDVGDVFLSLPYVEEIIMYKNGDDYFITSQGCISKNDFFTEDFYASEQNVESWEGVMNEYNSFSIIPVENNAMFSMFAKSNQKYFVISKPYSVYEVGAVVFINESKFLDFCGIKADSELSVTFFDSEGRVNISNAEDSENVDFKRLVKYDYYVNNEIFGDFEYTKWFNNRNMVYQFVVENKISSYFMWFVLLFLLIIVVNLTVIIIKWFSIYEIPMMTLREIDYEMNNNNLNNLPNIIKNYHKIMSVGEMRKIVLLAMLNNRRNLQNKSDYAKAFFSEKTHNRTMITVVFAFKEIYDKRTPATDDKEIGIMAKKYGIELFVFESAENRIAALLTIHNDGDREDKINKFFFDFINKYEDCGKVIIIKSSMFDELMDFADSYNEVLLISDNTGINDYNCVSCIKEQNLIKVNDLVLDGKANISRLLYSENPSEALDYINELFDRAFENNIAFKDYKLFAQIVYSEFVEAISGFTTDFEQIENLNAIFFEKFDLMCETVNVFGIRKFVVNLCNMMLSLQTRNTQKESSNTQIMQYINNNYKEDIYLEKVADHFGYTKKYLSYYFKHEFNIGFNEYVTTLRINEAKRLLSDTEIPVSKIFSEVGYVNQTTFNVAFKRITGTSPGDYRKRTRTKKD